VSASGVTRSMEATTAAAVRDVARRRKTLPNGWWGVLLLIATEAALLLAILASYFYLRFHAAEWPPPGIEKPKVALPFALTGALVLTSVPMAFAALAARRGRTGTTWGLIAFALLVQAGYLAVQIILFESDLEKFSPRDSAYGSAYFTVLAAHHVHVVLGLLLDVGILARLVGGLTNYRTIGVRVIALYWHFVNAMAILVVLTQLSPSL
jgi:cytochrome c oxidase subunit III